MEDVPTRVLSAERCQLGEGPTYDPSTGTAWWFDILERRLFECRIESGATTIHKLPTMGSALARIDAERQLIVTDEGLYIRFVADGRMELFAAVEADNPLTRSNDSRVHPSGTLWFGTMGRCAETGAGAIYALHAGKVVRLYPEISIPNAICFSPSGEIGYFTDTARNVFNRVPLDAATGLPVGDPVPLIHHRDVGGLDGAVVDADGLIWNARWGGGICARSASPRCNPVAPPSSARICRNFWSHRRGRAWTQQRVPPIPITAAPSCSRPGRAGGRSRT
jgi:sugar lactone lactonase YvrE